MNKTINSLMEANLLGVFNERDAQRRASAIKSTYAPDVRWTDNEGVSVGREALEVKAKRCNPKCKGWFSPRPVLSTRPRDSATWRGSSGPKAATRWPADSTWPSCVATSFPSSTQ
jgi:hypothetical protein